MIDKEVKTLFKELYSNPQPTLVYKQISQYLILIGVPYYTMSGFQNKPRYQVYVVLSIDGNYKIIKAYGYLQKLLKRITYINIDCTAINLFGEIYKADLSIHGSNLISIPNKIDILQWCKKRDIPVVYALLDDFDYIKKSISIPTIRYFCSTLSHWLKNQPDGFRQPIVIYRRFNGCLDIFKCIYENGKWYEGKYFGILDKYPELSLNDALRVLNCFTYCNSLIGWDAYLNYADYLQMRQELLNANFNIKCPLVPANLSEEVIKKWHDRLTSIYSKYSEIISQAKYAEQQSRYITEHYFKAKVFNFENEQYSITACKNLSELDIEGKVLNHCVGSYKESVSQGKEYILFLRKKDDINTPYFTLDLTPKRILRQAHGKCNCNVPPHLIPFIEEWAKQFKININNISEIQCHL